MIPSPETLVFYGAAFGAIAATVLVLLSSNAVNAVLYLVMSLFGVALLFHTLGATFLAVLEVIVYAGAIMVLFLFVVMMLNLGEGRTQADLRRPSRHAFWLPGSLAAFLAALTLVAVLAGTPEIPAPPKGAPVAAAPGPYRLSEKELGQRLWTHHYLGVELVSLILTIGIVGGMHLGRGASLAPDLEKAAEARRRADIGVPDLAAADGSEPEKAEMAAAAAGTGI